MTMWVRRAVVGVALIVTASTAGVGHAGLRPVQVILSPTGTTVTVNCINPRKCHPWVQFDVGYLPPHSR